MSRRLSPLVFLLASLVMMGAEGRALENKRLYGKHTLDAAADSQADAQADTKAGLGASKTAGDMEGVPPTPTVFPPSYPGEARLVWRIKTRAGCRRVVVVFRRPASSMHPSSFHCFRVSADRAAHTTQCARSCRTPGCVRR